MLDLKKYLDTASIDLSFKKRLLQNANQAIKEEFGENLPYQLKCKEKLVFEVEATDGVAESDLEGVAGGGRRLNKNIQAAKELMKQFQSDPQYTYPQPNPSNPVPNPSVPQDPARMVYGANPSARRW